MDISLVQIPKSSRPFRFEKMWLDHNQFDDVVQDVWNMGRESDIEFMEKLESCGREGNEGSDRNIANTAAEIDKLLRREEIMWRQRSKADWLKEGDRNTKFFHHKASSRKKNNSIAQIRDDFGEWRAGEDIAKVVVAYFNQLFTSSNPTNQS
ncbi:uncharacterized protein LOC126687503 [Mercurialis annua]|uniref:uncharacterized protein LOC126687503 n=1 Tax=Mercurialis annua TaxID=3986 RepID=UPI0021604C8A|nr:uncharacterized protein LOC126687503 [Mercurialis annua]